MALDFEWDETKAQENYAKHGVSFDVATQVFNDPLALELIDDREDYGEERLILIGVAQGYVLFVVFTERGEERLRIISARRAVKDEEDAYYTENR